MMCPFTKDNCYGEECELYLSDAYGCSFRNIAKQLEDISDILNDWRNDKSG